MSTNTSADLEFVPVVDIGPYVDGTSTREQVPVAVAKACETSGFLVVTGHGVPEQTIADMYNRTRAFFALPEDEKLGVAATPATTGGYRPLASSNLAASIDQAAPPDLCEFYSIAGLGSHTDSLAGDRNRWPSRPPEFGDAWRAYYWELERLARDIMRIFALALGLAETWFDDKIDRHCTALFANHYPAQAKPPMPGQLRLGPHTDFGSLTIVYQDDAPGGLQVQTPNGGWRDVPFVPGAFVVNIGDLMARWTNDRWVSTMHRVLNPPEAGATDRLSLPFFHQPNEDALIECIPSCTDADHPPKYEPVLSGEWRAAKIKRSRY